jgi:hypothetical protein
MSIAPLDHDLRRYIKHFNIAAIYVTGAGVTGAGGIRAGRNPPGNAERAYWLPADRVREVLMLARRNGGNIILAAQACGVGLTDHHRMVQRAGAAVARLDAQMAKAQRAGLMKYLNIEYKQRRQDARAQGRVFMPYRTVQARLRKAIVEVAAGDAPAIMRRVFDGLPDPQ